MTETAQQSFAKTLDHLKEAYVDLLVICDYQYKQLVAANKILDDLLKPLPKGLPDSEVIIKIKRLEDLKMCLSQEGKTHE